MGIGKGPEALTQPSTHKLDKGLVGITGEKRFEAVNINRDSDSCRKL